MSGSAVRGGGSGEDGVIRVLVVDDEPIARRGLRRLLAQRRELRVIAECRNGADAVKRIRADAPDLVFLDVQMPGLDGFGVVREIGAAQMPLTVFVTAYDEFAVRAFDVAAVDYVVKPFTDERFVQAVDRALARRAERRSASLHQRLLALLADASPAATPGPARPPAEYLTRILASVGARTVVIPVDEITWIRADDYYAALFTAARTSYLIREPLADLERRLDPRHFLRVHRSAIVRLACVRSLDRTPNGGLVVALHDGTRVPVSRSRRDAIAAALGGAR